jgi:hypothetical protein
MGKKTLTALFLDSSGSILIFILFFLILPISDILAERPSEAWTGMTVGMVFRSWEAGIRQENRFMAEQFKSTNLFSDLNLAKNISQNFSASAGLRFSKRNYNSVNANLLRYYGYILWQNNSEYLCFTARSGIQNDNLINQVQDLPINTSTIWRNLAELGYNFPKSKFSALVFCEFFKSFSQSSVINYEEIRLKPYIKYNISKNQSISSGYLYRYNYSANSREGHIVTFNYNARLNFN